MSIMNDLYYEIFTLNDAVIRLNNFYTTPEPQIGLIKNENSSDSEYALKIKGNFSWGIEKDRQTLESILDLKDIDLKVRKGELVVIVGEVGSGKSSLLNAIIGEMIFVPEKEIEFIGD